MNDKIKAMLEAKCAVEGCNERQMMYMTMPTKNPDLRLTVIPVLATLASLAFLISKLVLEIVILMVIGLVWLEWIIGESYPFCEKHVMKIMMHEIGTFRIKNGNIYGTPKPEKKVKL